MISINGKYIKNMGVYQGFEKNETATMFFLKKSSLVIDCTQRPRLKLVACFFCSSEGVELHEVVRLHKYPLLEVAVGVESAP